MDLLKPHSLEDDIVYFLKNGEKGTIELLSSIQSLRPGTTKQGFYAALRKLKAREVVVIYKKTVALNITWIRLMRDTLEQISWAYTAGGSDMLSLEDKESISYSFATIRQLDNFWGHAQNIVVQATPANEAVYTYDPHYWFLVARPEVERSHMDSINKLGKQFLMTVGGTTPLDRALLPEFNNQMRQYHMERVFGRAHYYVVVVGDFIFESNFSEDIERNIEDIYSRYEKPGEELLKEFESILTARVRTKLKISRNRLRARKLKTKLAKNFFVKRG